jgi:hypothetical protein
LFLVDLLASPNDRDQERAMTAKGVRREKAALSRTAVPLPPEMCI